MSDQADGPEHSVRSGDPVSSEDSVNSEDPGGSDEPGGALSAPEEETLLDVAEASVAVGLLRGGPMQPDLAELTQALTEPGACFVTLQRRGALLGCIGTLQPYRPLVSDVASNAYAAGFVDPRLPPVTVEDYIEMDVEISVLGRPEPLVAAHIEEAMAQVVPGVHGVVVAAPGHRATFLPAVWQTLAEPRLFFAELWRKAWLTPEAWPEGIVVSRYRVREIVRTGPRAAPGPG